MTPQHTNDAQWKANFQKYKTVAYLIYIYLFVLIFIPISTATCFIIWLIALPLSYGNRAFGRFATHLDNFVDEDFIDSSPRGSIITTMTLNGHLPLEQLKFLFTENVIEARLSTKPSKLRYPELQQYLTRFMGFRIWKNDPSFEIDKHIVEEYQNGPLDMQAIHEKLINKPYRRNSSPWEIVLVQTSTSSGLASSMIAARFHHAMLDGKSVLKMFVECLGLKPLKAARATPSNTSILQTLKFYLMFPINFVYYNNLFYTQLCKTFSHPLKNYHFRADKYSKTHVAFSPKLSLFDLKQIAKRNGVTSSSVVMSIVAGAVRKCGNNFADRDLLTGYPLPKENHPEFMTNHLYVGPLILPTSEDSISTRLQRCNETFLQAKTTQLHVYTDVIGKFCGFLVYPLSEKIIVNHFLPMFLTNMAGDEEGFNVGGHSCVDFRMSVGTMEGVAGLLLCVMSYKNEISVGIAARASVLSKKQTDKLGEDIAEEMKALIGTIPAT